MTPTPGLGRVVPVVRAADHTTAGPLGLTTRSSLAEAVNEEWTAVSTLGIRCQTIHLFRVSTTQAGLAEPSISAVIRMVACTPPGISSQARISP